MRGDISYIGSRINKLRKDRNMTLLELSEYTGLSTGHLSQIERGKTVPNIEHLISIAENLNTSISDLVEERPTDQNVIHKSEAIVRSYPQTNMTVYHYNFPDEPADFQLIEISPGKIGEQPWSRHKFPEAAMIISGSLTVLLGDATFELKEGDSLYIPAGVRHKLINEGASTCISTWTYLKKYHFS